MRNCGTMEYDANLMTRWCWFPNFGLNVDQWFSVLVILSSWLVLFGFIFLRTQLGRWNLRRELFHSLTFFFFFHLFFFLHFLKYIEIFEALRALYFLSKVILLESSRNHNQILPIERSRWNTYICILNVLRALLHYKLPANAENSAIHYWCNALEWSLMIC